MAYLSCRFGGNRIGKPAHQRRWYLQNNKNKSKQIKYFRDNCWLHDSQTKKEKEKDEETSLGIADEEPNLL